MNDKFKILDIKDNLLNVANLVDSGASPKIDVHISDGTQCRIINVKIFALMVVRVGWSFTGAITKDLIINNHYYESGTIIDGWFDDIDCTGNINIFI